MTAPTSTAPTTDGRTARRERNRELVLDATLALFAEGTLHPGPAEVAERSGVSLRSVHRYFEDRDSLIRAAIARDLEHVQPLFVIDDLGVGPVAERVERMVSGRFRLYEQIAPMMRATLLRAPSNDIIREHLDQYLRAMRRQVDRMFEPELSQMTAAEAAEVGSALDVVLGFHSLEHLRGTRALSRPQSQRIISRAVTALLGQYTEGAPS